MTPALHRLIGRSDLVHDRREEWRLSAAVPSGTSIIQGAGVAVGDEELGDEDARGALGPACSR